MLPKEEQGDDKQGLGKVGSPKYPDTGYAPYHHGQKSTDEGDLKMAAKCPNIVEQILQRARCARSIAANFMNSKEPEERKKENKTWEKAEKAGLQIKLESTREEEEMEKKQMLQEMEQTQLDELIQREKEERGEKKQEGEKGEKKEEEEKGEKTEGEEKGEKKEEEEKGEKKEEAEKGEKTVEEMKKRGLLDEMKRSSKFLRTMDEAYRLLESVNPSVEFAINHAIELVEAGKPMPENKKKGAKDMTCRVEVHDELSTLNLQNFKQKIENPGSKPKSNETAKLEPKNNEKPVLKVNNYENQDFKPKNDENQRLKPKILNKLTFKQKIFGKPNNAAAFATCSSSNVCKTEKIGVG